MILGRAGCRMAIRECFRANGAKGRIVQCVSVLIAALVCAPSLSPAPVSEQEVKAAFMFNFAKFVEWPPQTFSDSSSPFVVCSFGSNGVAEALKQGIEGKTVQNRTITVDVVTSASGAKACQVLYFDMTQTDHVAPLLHALEAAHVLTVGEMETFVDAGGIIGFVVRSNQLRFYINNAEAKKAGLKISSKLLTLAIEVKN